MITVYYTVKRTKNFFFLGKKCINFQWLGALPSHPLAPGGWGLRPQTPDIALLLPVSDHPYFPPFSPFLAGSPDKQKKAHLQSLRQKLWAKRNNSAPFDWIGAKAKAGSVVVN